MPVLTRLAAAGLWCALLASVASLVSGCHGGNKSCPTSKLTVDPAEIPAGSSETSVTVVVRNPNPGLELPVITELTASKGAFVDPFARDTTYTCPHDVVGEVEICVNTIYEGGPGIYANESSGNADESSGVGVSVQYLGKPHVVLPDPLKCAEVTCKTVTCPEKKNQCPVITELTAEPTTVPEGGTATIVVAAEDPDGIPNALVTTLSANHGTIADPSASQTTYQCDPDVGGAIEICATASDGDASCGVIERCISVLCPGEPLENTCPIIESFTAKPMVIPVGRTTADVRVVANDPDMFPEESLRTLLSSETGVFADRLATDTTFTCGAPGPVKLRVTASDGDPDCDKKSEITVECPSDIPENICPQLFVLNAIPSRIPAGQISTRVESRGQDTDLLPLPLTLTMTALWGTIENDENIPQPFNVVAQNATYICDRPGEVEICVDATDGACVKTLCIEVRCPADVPVGP